MAHVTSLFDAPGPPHLSRRIRLERSPGPARLVGAAVLHRAAIAGRAARGIPSSAAHPMRTASALVAGTRGALAFAAALRPTARTSLSGPLDSPRRYRLAEVGLDDITAIRDGLGGTLNDAVLAIVSLAFRALLLSRGESASPRAVRCLVPVSVRSRAGAKPSANRVAGVLIDLPVDFADPGSAYGATVVRTRAAKASHEIDAGELTVTLAEYLPPALTASALHATFRMPQHVLTTVVTNVPGPPAPARMLGRPLVALYPYVPIANRIRIGVAVTTYRDRLFFGVTCDRAAVSDSDVFVDGIHSGVADLVKAAAIARGAS